VRGRGADGPSYIWTGAALTTGDLLRANDLQWTGKRTGDARPGAVLFRFLSL
jgi:hypothetical protein